MNWIENLFRKNGIPENSDIMKKCLVVGLGNIGAEYVNTRHNIGFKIVDYVASKQGVSFEVAKLGAVAEFTVKGRKIILLKPNTYMNLSGKAIQYWMQKENIEKEKDLQSLQQAFNEKLQILRTKENDKNPGVRPAEFQRAADQW